MLLKERKIWHGLDLAEVKKEQVHGEWKEQSDVLFFNTKVNVINNKEDCCYIS